MVVRGLGRAFLCLWSGCWFIQLEILLRSDLVCVLWSVRGLGSGPGVVGLLPDDQTSAGDFARASWTRTC